MADLFPDVDCPRCHAPAQLNTVPLALIPETAEDHWQTLRDDCFRLCLDAEPSDDLKLHPIEHGRGRRRRVTAKRACSGGERDEPGPFDSAGS